MKSRRAFVKNSALAATALMAIDPIEALAAITRDSSLQSATGTRFVFLHAANLQYGNKSKALQFLKKARYNASSITMDAGMIQTNSQTAPSYDLSIPETLKLAPGEYQIINKGNIRTGIISNHAGNASSVRQADQLAGFLKKEKNCQFVVCVSRLGYQKKKKTDALTLASGSANLDIIISVHPRNPRIQPLVAINRNRSEVYIHPVIEGKFAVGKTEILLDNKGQRRSVVLENEHSLEPVG
ncbi:MAG: hypothetical protein ACO25B_11500 [Chitinophagaceae bacterium]